MFAGTSFATIDTAIIRSSRPVQFCKKSVLANSVKFTRKQQKGIPEEMLSCEFCKISHNIFLKETFGRLLLHKHSLCLVSYHDLFPFQKRCHTFSGYFFGLICSLGTKASSMFKTLSPKSVFNQVKHLGWCFSCENS